MIGVFVRIFLRWFAGFLVAKGLFAPDDATIITSDPEIERLIVSGIGTAVGAGTELWYWAAKRYGWAT